MTALPHRQVAQPVRSMTDVDARLRAIQGNFEAVHRTEPWRVVGASGQPAFENGWQNYHLGSGFQVARFFKDGFGVVHLEGLVNRGVSAMTANTVIFTLPSGCRPDGTLLFAANAAGGSGMTHTRVDVFSSGTVRMQTGPTTSGYLSLSGITFRAAA